MPKSSTKQCKLQRAEQDYRSLAPTLESCSSGELGSKVGPAMSMAQLSVLLSGIFSFILA